MQKTNFVFLFAIAFLFFYTVTAQSEQSVTITIKVVDKSLNVRSVPKHGLVIRSANVGQSERKVSTSFDGVAKVSLAAGEYTVRSETPLDFEGRTFQWSKTFTLTANAPMAFDLSNDNAEIVAGPVASKRRVSEAGELFKTLRNGVVTVEGELGNGTGFIFDKKGLVLTNYHVISETTEVRVRFDKNRSVRARVIAKDPERDLAVLHVNLSAFPDAQILSIAEPSSEPSAVIGEHVFTIGSPAFQDKLLIAGIVSKIEDKAIISDVSFNAGNSGGPFFNSVGDVVGITTFKVSDKEGAGLAGVIRIEEAAAMIELARASAENKLLPSAELMPNAPEGTFPVETIKNAIQAKTFSSKQYLSDVSKYDIKYMTPVYKFYTIEKDRIDSLKSREKRNNKKSSVNGGEMFRDLSIWNEYAGELMPVVDILALPEIAPTGKSLVLSAATALTVGYSTPFDNKYRADFYQMKLLCDGKEVTPIRRNKTEIQRDMVSYYKSKKRFTYAGVYSYPSDIFAPGRCTSLVLHVFSEEDIETPVVTAVSEAIKTRVWSDFADYRTQVGKVKM